MLSGFINSFDEQQLKRINNLVETEGCKKEILNIEIQKLSSILGIYHYSVVDYCNIDVEGGEMEVLKSIDFEKTRIKLFSIENNYNKSEVSDFLRKRGYTKIKKIGADEFYEFKSRSYLLILRLKVRKIKARLSIVKRATFRFFKNLTII